MDKRRVLVSAYACYPPTAAGADAIDLQLGGGESQLGWNLARQIGRFHEAVVLTDERNRHGIDKAIRREPVPGVEFVYLRVPVRWERFWHNTFVKHLYYLVWQRRALTAARRLHRERPFDLVHHLTYANDWIPSFIGARLPVPFLWGPFGGGQRYPKGFQREFTFKARLGEAGRLSLQWLGRHALPARRRALRRAGALLVCNRETVGVIPPRFRAKIEFFPVTAMDAEGMPPPPGPPPPGDGTFRILTASRLVLVKRVDFAIRALARMRAESPGLRAVLEVVGEGPERPRLERLAADLGLGDAVRFAGWTTRDGVLARMRASDAFVFPSLREGGGFVLVEAMASGRPVVCLDAAGPGFLVEDGWGIKVEPRDPEQVVVDLAAALGRLAGDAALRERLGRAGRARVEEALVLDRLGERLRDIYARVLAGGRGRP